MISVMVMWPNGENAAFDHEYYLGTHIPLVRDLLGEKLTGVSVEQGRGGLEPGAPPTHVAVTRLLFDSMDDFHASFGQHGASIRGDEPNFTNIDVQVQISEIVV